MKNITVRILYEDDITLFREILERVDRLVGPRGRAKFVREAIEHSLVLAEHQIKYIRKTQ